MSERFSETLRAASEPGWSHAVGHRFVKALFAGALLDAVMARYLTAGTDRREPLTLRLIVISSPVVRDASGSPSAKAILLRLTPAVEPGRWADAPVIYVDQRRHFVGVKSLGMPVVPADRFSPRAPVTASKRSNPPLPWGGTCGSNPLSSSGESGANLIFGDKSHR